MYEHDKLVQKYVFITLMGSIEKLLQPYFFGL